MRMMGTKVGAMAAVALLAIGLPLVAQSEEAPEGVVVTAVDPDGPAAAAGIERGDLILGLDGQEIGSGRDLVRAIAAAEGSEVTLRVKHGDDVGDQIVTLDRIWGRPRIGVTIAGGGIADLDFRLERGMHDRCWCAARRAPARAAPPGSRRPPASPPAAGAPPALKPPPPPQPSEHSAVVRSRRSDVPLQEHAMLSMSAVVVAEVASESAAAGAGLQRGDWITAVDGVALDGSSEQLADIIGDYQPGDEVSIDYKRDGEEKTAMVTLGENPDSGTAMLGIRYQAPIFKDGNMLRMLKEMKLKEMKERVGGRFRTLVPEKKAKSSGDVDANRFP